MSAILNSLNAHNFLSCQPILMTLVPKFMVYRALSDKSCLLLGLRSPLISYEMTMSVRFCLSYDHLNGVCFVSFKVNIFSMKNCTVVTDIVMTLLVPQKLFNMWFITH